MARILIACEQSGVVRSAFARRGHNAWSCDLLPTEIPGQHFQCDVREVLNESWDLIVAHPDCTYLCNSGVRWLDNQNGKVRAGILTGAPRWKKMWEACEFFRLFLDHPCPKIAIENPVMHKYAKRWVGTEQSQVTQPWMFGEPEKKATCWWLKGLPLLKPTKIIPLHERKSSVHFASPGEFRDMERSRTLAGVAEALAEQWGSLL